LAASNSSRSNSSIAPRLRSSTLRTDLASCASAGGAPRTDPAQRATSTTRRRSAAKDDELHAAVLRAPGAGAVVGDGDSLAEAARLHAPFVDAPGHEVLDDRLGAALRQLQVEAGVAAAVGVPLDAHADGGVVLQRLPDLVEQRVAHRLDRCLGEVEEDRLLELDLLVGDG